jgi:RHS repeat-associated protein
MTDGTGTSTYTYDSLGRLTQTGDGAGNQISFAYDLAGNQTSVIYPSAKTVARAYDADNRLASVTDWLGDKTTFAYNPDSGIASTTFPAATGNFDSYSYNTADQLTGITFAQTGGSALASLSYTRDPAGLLSAETATGLPGQGSTSYSYTPLEQLASAGSNTYKYDKADDLTVKDTTTSYTYDQANQLTASGTITHVGMTVPTGTYAYDSLGERISATAAPRAYSYDQAGRLTAAAPSGTAAATFAYNGDGLRTTENIPGGASATFAWDTTGPLPLLLSDGQNSYIYGPADLPIEQISSSGIPSYLHHDQLGSTRLITSQTGAHAGSFTYSPYGTLTASTGTVTTPLGYAGQYTDPQAGLVYLRARYYDPSTGQFLTRDPLEAQTRQPYSYAGDNPTNYTDPTGKWFGLDDLVVAGAGALVGAGLSAGEQLVSGNGFSVTKVLVQAGAGAAGAEAGYYCGPACGGAVAGGLSNLGGQLTDHGSVNPVELATATAYGGAIGAVIPIEEGAPVHVQGLVSATAGLAGDLVTQSVFDNGFGLLNPDSAFASVGCL